MVKRFNLKTLKGLITLFLLVLLIYEADAQNEVAIGSNTTKSNAILWLNGNGSQGLILPVVTGKTAVSGPDKGMIVYDNSDNKVWYRSDNAWVEVGGGTGTGDNGSLTLQIQGNQLQLHDGTTTLSSVNIAGGTPANGAFMVWNGSSWQSTMINDVSGTNGQVTGIKGKTVPNLPTSTQALVYDGSAWTFQPLTGSDSQTLTFTSPNLSISNGNSVNLSALDKDAQTLTLTGNNLSISGGNAVTLPSTGVTSVTAGTGLTGGTITTTGTIGLGNSGVTSGIYGSATAIPQMTVDAFGRITAVTTFPPLVADGSITGGTPGIGVKIAANTITDANILNLNASKINSGTLPIAQVPNLDAAKITTGTFGTGQIPNLDASKITTGAFNPAQIPDLDASKITSGIIPTTQGGTGLNLSSGSIGNGQLLIGANPGFVKANLTAGSGINIINGAGSITISSTATGSVTNVSGTAPITVVNGTTAPIISLANTAVLPNTYGTTVTIPQITVDAQGRITGANNQSIPTANTTTTGLLSNTDWNTFNSKGNGTVTNVTGTIPVTVTNGSTAPIISMSQANTTSSGYLSSADWNTFNNKGAGTVTSVTTGTGLTGGPITATGTISLSNTAVTPATYGTTLTIPQIVVDQQGRITSASNQTIPTANTAATGLLSNTDWNTFNSKGNGTVTNVTGSGPINVATGTTTPVISLANTAVSPGTYGTALTIPQIAIDAQGRITSANNQTIPTANTTTTGLLSSADWNTFNSKGTGTVTSVGLTMPSIFTVTASPVTISGTLTTTLASQAAATVFAAPAAAAGTPTFRALASTDIPALDASKITTGTFATARIPSLDASQITTGLLPVANGGTGKNTWSGLVYGSGATLGDISDGTAGQFLRMVGTTPGWQTFSIIDTDVDAAAAISGTKINPDFGVQNITTTGSLNTGISTTFGSAALTWPASNAAGTLTNDGTGTLSWGISNNFSTLNTIPKGNGTTLIASQLFDNGSNVGIGTTNPLVKLAIRGRTYIWGNGDAGTSDGDVFQPTIDLAIDDNDTGIDVLGDGALAFISNAQEQIRVTTGSVGIGTTTPTAKLEVFASGAGFRHTDGNVTVESQIGASDAWFGAASANHNFHLLAGGFDAMIIRGDNNSVGIGRNPIIQKLEVEGGGYFNGDLEIVNQVKITGGSPANGYVLTSDATGLATWQAPGAGSGWSLTGNATIATNFIGTTNAQPLNFRVNNDEAGIIDPTNFNTAFGQLSGASLTTGAQNTAFGYNSLNANSTGVENTAFGYNALRINNVTSYNTAVGRSALFSQTAGSFGSNTAIGYQALYQNTTGYLNTSLGYMAGSTQGSVVGTTTGNNNTYIGANAGPTNATLTNATAIGAGATVNASNKVRIGNASVTVVEGQVSYSNSSDRRLKNTIKEIDFGLDFIKKLKPVSYLMNSSDSRKNWGFIAQDIETLLGTDNAILTVGDDSLRTLSLRYTDFIAPMVKAMQEQQTEIEELKAKLKAKDEKVNSLEGSVAAMKDELEDIKRILGVEAKAKAADKKVK